MGPRLSAALIALAAATCKQPSSVRPTAPKASAAAAASDGVPEPTPESRHTLLERATLGQTDIELIELDNECFVRDGQTKDAASPLRLEMTPPCHFVKWSDAPPASRRASSGGVAQGEDHGPAVWFYPDANDASVVLVVGTPPRTLDDEKAARAAAAQCGSQARGVRMKSGKLTLSRLLTGNLFCARTAIDEKTYWMIAHERL